MRKVLLAGIFMLLAISALFSGIIMSYNGQQTMAVVDIVLAAFWLTAAFTGGKIE